MIDALENPYFRRALLAGLLSSVACGIIGTYVVVKRMASVSGGLSHAAFGGIGLGHLLGFSPMLGAAVFSVASGLGIGFVYRRVRSGLDTLIAMFWSVGMALGVLFIELKPGYVTDLKSYLFGSILLVPLDFILLSCLLDVVIIAAVALLYKEFQGVSFDEEFSGVIGVPVTGILLTLMALTSLVVVVLIRVVGVILVIALLTIPAATARQWSRRLVRMMLLAVVLSFVCTTFGLILSYALSAGAGLDIDPSPLIILTAAILFGASTLVTKGRVSRGSENA